MHESFFVVGPDGRGITLEDPSGGTFSGAAGFPTSRPETPLLAALDVYNDTILDSEDARALLPEIRWLLDHVGDSNPGRTSRHGPVSLDGGYFDSNGWPSTAPSTPRVTSCASAERAERRSAVRR